MNRRKMLSLAALSLTLPGLVSAQPAPAAPPAEAAAAAAASSAPVTAAEPATAPAPAPPAAPPPAPAPAVTLKPYGFILLTYNQSQGTFKMADYPGQLTSEDGRSTTFSARQSRMGLLATSSDGGLTGAKLAARLEFDFFGPGATSWDSAPARLRYAYFTAAWDLAALGKLTLLAGQTDGLVAPLHPDLVAYIATPMFMFSGNLFRRSPQLRATYDLETGPVAFRGELAALSPTDATSPSMSAGNASGRPDVEGRLQVGVKPMNDVSATVGVAFHVNRRHYAAVPGVDDADNTKDVYAVAEADVTASNYAIDLDLSVPYFGLRGEFYRGKATDDVYFGIGPGVAVIRADTNPITADEVTPVESSGWWVQGVVKPHPIATIFAGYGRTEVDDADLAAHGAKSEERLENVMINAGVAVSLAKAWRVGIEYTRTTSTTRNKTVSATDLTPVTFEGTGSAVAVSSRLTF